MQARFGEGYFSYIATSKKIYSIRLVPGSNPGQPIQKKKIDILIHFIYKLFLWVDLVFSYYGSIC